MKALKFLRKSWPIWAVWVGIPLFIVGLAINPFWTFVVIGAGLMIGLFIGSVFVAIDLAKKET